MEYILSDCYDGKTRKLFRKICIICEKIFYVPKCVFSRRKYCSRACRDKSLTTRIRVRCARCNKQFEIPKSHFDIPKSGLHFCSRKCKDLSQRLGGIKEIQPPHYGTAPFSRKSLIRTRGRRCQSCGKRKWLNHPIPIEIHHINGNRSDNRDENLAILCCNCHAMTLNYNGRKRVKQKSKGT